MEKKVNPIDYWYKKYLNKPLELTWLHVARIITIYENEIFFGNISRYDGKIYELQKISKKILDKFNEAPK